MILQKATSGSSYGLLTKLLHWAVLALLMGQFISIWTSQLAFRSGRDYREFGLSMLDIHKALGLLLIAVVVLRLLWRMLGGLPEWAPGLAEWEKAVAHRLERWLYILMFAAPISGVIYSITSGYPIKFFGFFAIPVLMQKVAALSVTVWFIHMTLSYLFVGVLALHLGFVIRRNIYEKDGYVSRMTF